MIGLCASTVMLAAAGAGAGPAYAYEVDAAPGARTLQVQARFAAGTTGDLVVERGMMDYVEGAEVGRGGRWEALQRSDAAFRVAECERAGCTVRYRFDLARAAHDARHLGKALDHEGALLAPPSTWLVRPRTAAPGRYRLVVRTPPGTRFVSGVFHAPDDPEAYEADTDSLDSAPYSGFGAFETKTVRAGGGSVEVAVAPGARRLSNEALWHWVEQEAGAVSGFYGRLPVPRVLLLLVPGGRRAVGFGTTLGSGGASVAVFVGSAAGEDDLARDWVLAHELSHLGLPDLSEAPPWIEEGLATYVEPIARAKAGLLSEATLWREMMDGLPRGLSGPGDGGLDSAQGYGRIYWGGALYWLLCDLDLRERTHGARGLQQALAGLVAGGANVSLSWSLARAVRELERAAGEPVFGRRLRAMGAEPVREDLEALWRRFGVERRDGGVAFDDAAPLAAFRRSLTAPEPGRAAAR